ncbi:MAG: hypothetical protein LBC48_06335 [Dysgonamonadaceae bacterium]|jgi:hypothetical protein|nr:hypothetical protein [Dysgonamonadaceae bacterium]
MALDNMISVSFTEEELLRIDEALSTIEAILKDKVINLTPKQRSLYGRVAYDMEVWVDKVDHYMQQVPQLIPSFINMEEHAADLEAHRALNPRIERINVLLQGAQDINLLLGSDIYNSSIAFYRAIREAAKSNAPGASTIYTDLKRQFPGGGKREN